MCSYQLRTDWITDELGDVHTVYGIEAMDCDGTILQSVPDLFFDRTRAEAFVALCTTQEVSPIHLMEVIDNELAKDASLFPLQ